MKVVTIKEISQELLNLSPKELRDLCLRLSGFKKENKELITYLLFEASDEASYIESEKKDIDLQFDQVSASGNSEIIEVKKSQISSGSIIKIISLTGRDLQILFKKKLTLAKLYFIFVLLKQIL